MPASKGWVMNLYFIGFDKFRRQEYTGDRAAAAALDLFGLNFLQYSLSVNPYASRAKFDCLSLFADVRREHSDCTRIYSNQLSSHNIAITVSHHSIAS